MCCNMDNNFDLKQLLIDGACKKGICSPGLSMMQDAADIDSLIDYYLANPDWCLERSFPTLPFLRENFSGIEDKGVFVCKTFRGEMLNEKQVYIFHKCRGTIKVGLNVDKGIIPMLYLANGCRMRIVGVGTGKHVKSPSVVPVYMFGRNDMSARDNKYVVFRKFNEDLI